MNYINEIAEALGLSTSTVYRVLARSKDVGSETQRRVFKYVTEHYPEKLAYRAPIKGSQNKRKVISIVMPCKPYYYWNLAIDGMQAAKHDWRNVDVELNFIYYSNAISEREILLILNEINTDIIDGLVIVPADTEAVRNRLSSISRKIPIALFSEHCTGCGCLIDVISDAYSQGEAAAKMLINGIKKDSCILTLSTNTSYPSKIFDDRVKGFSDTIKRSVPYDANIKVDKCIISVDSEETSEYFYNSTLAAMIARCISAKIDEHDLCNRNVQAVYSPNGDLYPLLMGLKKLKRIDIMAFGHEFNPKVLDFFNSGMKGGYVKQDV